MIKAKFEDLFLIKNKNFKDQRGYFKEIIRENKFKKRFPFLVMSYSKQNVVRGLHIQTKNSQGKFVTVIKGKIFDVAIDLRKNSKTFGKVYSCILSEKNTKSIFIPEGFAHGFQALEKVLEKTSGKYCVGDNVTAADLYLVPQGYNANRFGVDMSQFPTIARIEKTLSELPDFEKAHPAAQPDAVKA